MTITNVLECLVLCVLQFEFSFAVTRHEFSIREVTIQDLQQEIQAKQWRRTERERELEVSLQETLSKISNSWVLLGSVFRLLEWVRRISMKVLSWSFAGGGNWCNGGEWSQLRVLGEEEMEREEDRDEESGRRITSRGNENEGFLLMVVCRWCPWLLPPTSTVIQSQKRQREASAISLGKGSLSERAYYRSNIDVNKYATIQFI